VLERLSGRRDFRRFNTVINYLIDFCRRQNAVNVKLRSDVVSITGHGNNDLKKT